MGATTEKFKKEKNTIDKIAELIRQKMEDAQAKKQGDIKIIKTQTPNIAGRDMRLPMACARRLGDCLDKGSLERWA